MTRLIDRLRFAEFSSPEPNPFRILDRMKQEYGDVLLRDQEDQGNEELNGSDVDDGDDDEDDDDEEDDDKANAPGILEYLTSCSVM